MVLTVVAGAGLRLDTRYGLEPSLLRVPVVGLAPTAHCASACAFTTVNITLL